MLLIVLLLAATAAQAETYKWTDKAGTVHFSESLGVVPAKYRKSAQPLGIDLKDTSAGNNAVSSVEPSQRADDKGSVAPQVEGLKERMMKDEGVMSQIKAMQGDPEMQLLLNDPALRSAAQSGDIGTLMNNPAFMKLLNNPTVRDIEKSMQNKGMK